ncbi:MAG TPA: ATP-binding protein [Thermoanaerobaculia bacterium]|jgi:DNA helicase HerA-like ATPase|nr:ATP-binding protein [Thermoanaerobaculia bacterium]
MTTPIERIASLTIGFVESVSPDEIHVILDIDAPQTVALNAGVPTSFPRVNGYIIIPNESGAVVGLVVFLGVERSPFPRRTGLKDFGLIDLPFPLRKLFVTPLGTLKTRQSPGQVQHGYFLERGVVTFPSVGDPVLLPTAEQLRSIVEAEGSDRRLQIGTSPLAANARVFVDPDKLFGRHLAVLGNTGSGKSCSVAGLVRWSLDAAKQPPGGKAASARFIILDPNGEYLRTFEDLDPKPVIFQVSPDADSVGLRVPAWMWNSLEWTAFAQASPRVQRPVLMEGLRGMRSGSPAERSVERRLTTLFGGRRAHFASLVAQGPQSYAMFPKNKAVLDALKNVVDEVDVYNDTARQFEEELAVVKSTAQAVRARRIDQRGYERELSEIDLTEMLDAFDHLLTSLGPQTVQFKHGEDDPVSFDLSVFPDFLEAVASIQAGGSEQYIATLTWRIRGLLNDGRLKPIIGSDPTVDLQEWVESFLGTEERPSALSIIDMSLVPAEIIHIVISVVARMVFEAIQRYRRVYGDELPTVLVLEEAHTFIHRGRSDEEHENFTPAQMCRMTFEKIAREGRKFGLGLLLSSQRPYELSPTVLAQCNTFLLHRLVNDQDQELVARLVPDNVRGILRELPSLAAGHAILLGWASAVPILVEMTYLSKEHQPHSNDPEFWRVWTRESERKLDWTPVIEDWTRDVPDSSD